MIRIPIAYANVLYFAQSLRERRVNTFTYSDAYIHQICYNIYITCIMYMYTYDIRLHKRMSDLKIADLI